MSWRNVLTEDQIVHIAKSKGMFTVSLRWRDDQIRSLCFRMKKRGLLTGGRRHGKHFYFYPVRTEKANDPGSSRSRGGAERS